MQTSSDDTCVGVDLNRNFPSGWNMVCLYIMCLSIYKIQNSIYQDTFSLKKDNSLRNFFDEIITFKHSLLFNCIVQEADKVQYYIKS